MTITPTIKPTNNGPWVGKLPADTGSLGNGCKSEQGNSCYG